MNTQIREISSNEIDLVSGGLTILQRVAVSLLPGGGILLGAYDLQQSYQAGWDGAHGRAERS